jgi:hypothetical protein
MAVTEMTDRQRADRHAFEEFGERRRWLWKFGADGDANTLTAQRRFTYRCGASATIGVTRPADLRRTWEAFFSVPFSAGPEGSLNDRRFEPARDWALLAEQVLTAPLQVEKACTIEEAERALRVVDRNKAWWTICIVFDLDYFALTDERMRARVIELQAPHLVRQG